MTHFESLYCFKECFTKNTKNNLEKRGKSAFWAQFWPNFDHFGLKLGHSYCQSIKIESDIV